MLRFKRRKSTKQKGFTIIELMVVAPVVILTIGAFVTVIVSMTGDVLVSRTANATLFSVQDSLNRIEQDIKLSSGFLSTSGDTTNNNFALTAGQGYDDGTQIFKNVDSTTGTMLILNTIATTGNPLLATSAYVYARDPLNACNSAQVIQNTPQSMNIIYFVKNGTLWRRTVMQPLYNNTVTNWCSLPWQLPTCTPGYSPSLTFCKADDIQLIDGLGTTGFDVQYFNGSNATLENTTASDTGVGVTNANRLAALQSATTASVSLTSTKSVAGRDSTQTATLRATRLDINASSLVVPVIATTPTAPVVTATTSAPTTALFTWPAVNGAVSYTIDYSTNGGGNWTNGFTNQTTRTFTYSGATHGQTVSVRVSATNTAGTSSYGTANVTIPLWVTPLLQNNWSDYGAPFSTAGYTKTSAGLVALKGLIKRSGAAVSGETLFTLPVGYRPPYAMTFAVNSLDLSATMTIGVDGTVVPTTNVNASYLSLETVVFYPTTYSGTWTNFSMLNGWTNRGNTNDPPFSYNLDSSVGRMNVRGALTPGTQTDGTIINSPAFAVGNRPALYQHISLRSGGNGYNMIGLDTSGNVLAKGGSAGTALFTNFSYLPTSYTGTWTTIPLVNSWVAYSGSFASPQYTKTADGMVTLKGLIRSGTITSGTVIGTLPAGFRPAKTALIDSICAGLFCRFDIENNGNIIARAGISATWTSLDGITFLAEQ
jgi:Tfp pilus assembly protein PilE